MENTIELKFLKDEINRLDSIINANIDCVDVLFAKIQKQVVENLIIKYSKKQHGANR